MAGLISKLNAIGNAYLRNDIPTFEVGDTVKMKIKVQEADKIRLHSWEGIVISKTGAGITRNFTVRKATFGEGVEKVFPINSPVIASLKVISKGNVNRAKLFYLRDKTGKGARVETVAVPQGTAAEPSAN